MALNIQIGKAPGKGINGAWKKPPQNRMSPCLEKTHSRSVIFESVFMELANGPKPNLLINPIGNGIGRVRK